MHDRALIRTGAAGAIVVAICCAAPLLAVPRRWPASARG